MRFINNNQKIFQIHSSIHSINTRNKHHLHRPNANLSCFKKVHSIADLYKLDVLFMYCIYIIIICILLSWLVLYCTCYYFNDMFHIQFVGSLEYWINKWKWNKKCSDCNNIYITTVNLSAHQCLSSIMFILRTLVNCSFTLWMCDISCMKWTKGILILCSM